MVQRKLAVLFPLTCAVGLFIAACGPAAKLSPQAVRDVTPFTAGPDQHPLWRVSTAPAEPSARLSSDTWR